MTNNELSKLYNSFPKGQQDINQAEFVKRMKAVLDPRRMEEDLIRMRLAEQERRAIDYKLRNRGT